MCLWLFPNWTSNGFVLEIHWTSIGYQLDIHWTSLRTVPVKVLRCVHWIHWIHWVQSAFIGCPFDLMSNRIQLNSQWTFIRNLIWYFRTVPFNVRCVHWVHWVQWTIFARFLKLPNTVWWLGPFCTVKWIQWTSIGSNWHVLWTKYIVPNFNDTEVRYFTLRI